MKKIKFLLLACTMLLLGGCVVASYEITINENDTGEFSLTVAHVDTDDDTSWESIINEIPNATTEDISFEKNGQTYIGKKVIAPFSSINELNKIFLKLSEDSEDPNGTDNSIKIEAKRDGNKVSISSEADPEAYEQAKMFLQAIDFKFSLKTAGTVSTHNATTVENNAYNWDYATLLRDGINFEYVTESSVPTDINNPTNTNDTTDHNYIILGIIGAMAVTIVALSIACINTVIVSKKK